MFRRPDAAQQRIVLAIVAAHPDASNPIVRLRQIDDDPPRPVAAGIFDENDLKVRCNVGQLMRQLAVQIS